MVKQKHPFKGRQFTSEVILWAVRWYLQFPISYRDLELMLRDRGVSVDHTTACCTEEEETREPPFPAVDQATRTESGRPRSSIRLRTWAAMATSVARAWSLWKRSPSPMTCFQRANWPSTPAL